MPNNPESISYIKVGEENHPIDAVTIKGKTILDESSYLPSISGTDESKMLGVIEGQWEKFMPTSLYELINGLPVNERSYEEEYLTFDVLTPGTILWTSNGENASKTISYSINGGSWTEITASDSASISVEEDDVVRFKGLNNTYGDTSTLYSAQYNNFSNFSGGTATYNVSGNIMSLVYGDNFIGQTTIPAINTFRSLFKNNASVISAENLVLPADTLTNSCYQAMFSHATSLVTAPKLPATNLATGCYKSMFDYTALTEGPALPANIMKENCYEAMFDGCTQLTTAPDLAATHLYDTCYQYMFRGCTSLNRIRFCGVTRFSNAKNPFLNILSNASSSGTLVKNKYIKLESGKNSIPSGWTVVDEAYDEDINTSELPDHDYSQDYLTFSILNDGTIGWISSNSSEITRTIQYSINNGTWTSLTSGDPEIEVSGGDTVRFKGTNNDYGKYVTERTIEHCGFGSIGSASFEVSGNIMSLIYGDNFVGQTSLPSTYSFRSMFDNSNVISAKNLILPTTTLTTGCYRGMFSNCSSLVYTPELPATTLAIDCYAWMFSDIISLVAAPDLLATTSFAGCYQFMFKECKNLSNIRCLLKTYDSLVTVGWVNSVATYGVFIKNSSASWPYGNDGIPTNWITYDEDSGDSDSDADSDIDYSKEFLTFEVLTAGDIVWKRNGNSGTGKTIYYSKNGGYWTAIEASATPVKIPVVAGDIVRFSGTNNSYATSNVIYCGFGDASAATATYNVSGNIMSLVYGSNFIGQNTLPSIYTFCSLFDKSGIVSAENLVLPATTMTEGCYRAMFANCPNLTDAPELPATTLALNCYRYMFDNDSELRTPPDLLAETLAQECYYGMFNQCTNLHYIKCLATDISASNCIGVWTGGLPLTGTFVKDVNMDDFPIYSTSGIPTGWTITNVGTLVVCDPIITYENNTITLSCSTYNAIIYYKLNQTGEYQIYLGPISISDDTFIETYATRDGITSNTVSSTCVFVPDEGDSDSDSEEPIHDYSKDYLTFEILTPGTLLWKGSDSTALKTIEYSINNGPWTTVTATVSGTAINVSRGDVVRLRGNNTRYADGDKSKYSGFDAGSATFNVSGNIMSLLAGDNFENATTLPTSYTFCQFFKNSLVVSAENLVLPAETLTDYCYRGMFSKCLNLAMPPALPATTLSTGCYYYMFEECAFERAPDLPAATVLTNSYYYMFLNCTSLNYVKCLATTHAAGNTNSWLKGVAATGTFVKHPNATWTTGISAIPTGWVVYDLGEEPEPEIEPEYEGEYPALMPFKYLNNEVTLPYSINATDGHSSSYAKGSYTFISELYLDEVQPTYLWFDHADQSADIYVDNVFVETHWGGYCSFFSDITEYVHTGKNIIKVILNNTTRQTLAPCSADFNFNATLGKVEILTSPVLPPIEYGYDGFHITSTVSSSSATINVTTSVPTTATLVLTIDDGTYHYTDTQTDTGDITFSTTIQNPHLWDGKSDPHLYNVTLEIYHNNTLYHTFTRPYGFRYYTYVYNDTSVLQSGDPYTGFLLNGHPYQLRGVCMHQDIEGKANALSSTDIAHDFDIITELGANFIRTAHYPHPREFYDYCDRLGIVVQTEVPMVNVLKSTQPADYYTHLEGQYIDMVTQHYNHPSIIFWGLGNEFNAQMDDSSFACIKLESFRDLIKSYDTERLVGCVLNANSSNPRNTVGGADLDWYGCNIYVGWYSNSTSNNPTNQIRTRLNNVTNRPIAYSEYGCGGNPNCHSDNHLSTTTCGSNKPRHDIEHQMWLHEGHIAAIKSFPQLIFTSMWVLFDFAVTSRQEGYTICLDGENTTTDDSYRFLNNKGLVERDHTTKKDTFYLYKAWWNTTSKFVHICQKNYEKYTSRVVKCYTNDGSSLSLYVNNTFVETVTVTNNIAEFTARNFEDGDVIRVNGAITNDTWTIPIKPLTLKILSDGNINLNLEGTTNQSYSYQYSKNNGDWTNIVIGSDIPVLTGDVLEIKGNSWTYIDTNTYLHFGSTCQFSVEGNPASLKYGENLTGNEVLGSNSYSYLFYNCINLTDASKLSLSKNTLTSNCYSRMFGNCTSLVYPPVLSSATLALGCYSAMFSGCSSLTTAPVLPATTLANNCYASMFSGCSSLTTAPVLPATTLANNCYNSMFNGCSSLTAAPVLPASILVTGCYSYMFEHCNSIKEITCLATDISATNSLYRWTYFWGEAIPEVPGTFYKNAGVTYPVGSSGIPYGWTVVDV